MSVRFRMLVACALIVGTLVFTVGCSDTPNAQEPAENPTTEFENAGDTAGAAPGASSTESAEPAEPSLDQRVASKVASLTLEQKVAQLFVVTPEALTGVDTVTQAGTATQEALQTLPVGGIAYFQKNLIDPDQTRTMLANTQSFAQEAVGLPLFMGVDEEGGTVSRIGGNPGFDIANVGDMAAIGATGDTSQAQAVALSIGTYLHDLGFNLDFAPDSDICGDPTTDVMALRSFGGDPTQVGSMVAAQVEGFSNAGILCSAKHFPGIGGVTGDSHEGTILSNKTLDELRTFELVPFKAAIEAGVPLVMVGHLSTPNATGDNTPASINPIIVSDLLRNELSFEGLIITDSMGMGALEAYCTPDQAGVAALQAGVDLVLMPTDLHAAYQGVLDAIASGTLTEARIDESVTRIVKAKLPLVD